MDKNDFLKYRALVREVQQLKDYVETLDRALSSVSSPQFSLAPKAPHAGGSALEARVARYLEMKDLYEAQLAKSEAQVHGIEQAIQSLEVPVERLVMRFRYLDGRSWASICSELQTLGYSERQAYYIHGFALKKLKEA